MDRRNFISGALVLALVASTPALGVAAPSFAPTRFLVQVRGNGPDVILIPGLTSGATGLSFSDGAGGETTVAGVQVVNGGVTILDSTVLP